MRVVHLDGQKSLGVAFEHGSVLVGYAAPPGEMVYGMRNYIPLKVHIRLSIYLPCTHRCREIERKLDHSSPRHAVISPYSLISQWHDLHKITWSSQDHKTVQRFTFSSPFLCHHFCRPFLLRTILPATGVLSDASTQNERAFAGSSIKPISTSSFPYGAKWGLRVLRVTLLRMVTGLPILWEALWVQTSFCQISGYVRLCKLWKGFTSNNG